MKAPWLCSLVLLVPCLVFLATFSANVWSFDIVYEPDSLWLRHDDFTIKARTFRQRMFGRGREENFVVTAKHEGDNVLTTDVLDEVLLNVTLSLCRFLTELTRGRCSSSIVASAVCWCHTTGSNTACLSYASKYLA